MVYSIIMQRFFTQSEEAQMAEENAYTNASTAIEAASVARDAMEDAYIDAFDEFAEVKALYQKFTRTAAGPTGNLGNLTGLVKKFAPMTLKFFGAGGAGAGLMLALSQDGTGAGILSRIGGLFGIGGP